MKTFYQETGSEIEIFENCFRKQLPLLIKGPTGCGKSQFVHFMAERLNVPLIQIACNEDTNSADLLGRFLIQGQETVWQDGPVTRAVRQGAILYLDEIAEAREDVVVALHPLTDHRRELFLDRRNEALTAPKSFMCVASFNPGYQKGFREMKPSTRQRFVTLSMSYPTVENEVRILQRVTGADIKICEQLVQFAHKLRHLQQIKLRESVSTRLLVNVLSLNQTGIPMRLACRVGIAEVLSDDGQTVSALVDLINLHF